MKGIILAGGKGSRLYPVTLSVCKQLLPVFDKPLIYYALSTLMLASIREILLICTPHDLKSFQELLQDGSQLGLNISYAVQPEPKGIAEAFLIGASFVGQERVALILGDNIFYGERLTDVLAEAQKRTEGVTIFGYEVKDPGRYGVIEFDALQKPRRIVEKPADPPSSVAVTGLYFYDSDVVQMARELKPSARGELEISAINQRYLEEGKLAVELLDRGFAWLDTGTFEALQSAALYVHTLQERQGICIGCIEEIAYRMGFIDEEQLERLSHRLTSSPYGNYLRRLIKACL